MRVLYASAGYTPHDHRFLQAIAETGDEIQHLMLGSNRGIEQRKYPPGVQRSWSIGRKGKGVLSALTALPQAQRVLRQVQPDLVHAGPVHTVALMTAFAWRGPQVSMSWGSDLLLTAESGVARSAARMALRRSDAFIGDCQAVAEAAANLGFPTERMAIFPWGVDLVHFSEGSGESLRKRLGWDNAFILLSTRAHEKLYGVDTLVRAFVAAAVKLPELRLLLLGEGSQTNSLHRMIIKAGLQANAAFEGNIDYRILPEYYRAADLYLSASIVDGSSVSLLEAMACGLPCLVSDIPGNREWVQPEESGWIFTPGDHAQLAAGVVHAARNRNRLVEMGEIAHTVALARADWNRNKAGIQRAYQMAQEGWDRRS